MATTCAVYGCKNRSNRDMKRFYIIPPVITYQGDQIKELCERRRQQWITNLGMIPTKHTRICSDHFITGKPADLYDTKNPDWAPTLKMATNIVGPYLNGGAPDETLYVLLTIPECMDSSAPCFSFLNPADYKNM